MSLNKSHLDCYIYTKKCIGRLMTIFTAIKTMIMRNTTKLKSPVFYKSDSDAKKQLERLESLHIQATAQQKIEIERDIKLLSYGIYGEENVAFELSNSYLPLIVLHDLRLEYEGLSAQIDYLIITPKLCLIVECKNLYGNITINQNGEFIREINYNRKRYKEGIYSPITQNMRHLEMVKRIGMESKKNGLFLASFEKHFADNYKSVIVLSNPKTIVNMKAAPGEIKKQIIRTDQLITHIKKLNKESKNLSSSEKQMYQQAEFFMRYHKENLKDYTQKHVQEVVVEHIEQGRLVEDTAIYQELKRYRYAASQAEGVKAFQVFTNAQLNDLILKMPSTLDELKQVSGFGEVRASKYGAGILRIVEKYR